MYFLTSTLNLSVIMFLASLSIPTSGLDCYSCSVCRQPFSKKTTDTMTGCTVCSVSQTWVDGKRVTTTRGCDNSCSSVDLRIKGNGLVKTCCKTDLCNGNTNLRWFKSIVLFSGLIVFKLTHI
uniref:CD59-like protein n=1 Tax=Fasciola hepatica TaxID=6192 RepID=A0A097F1L7_FASHE|nr:CD59-like protein [Fasciola hepatica]